jgi:hypothetical protein
MVKVKFEARGEHDAVANMRECESPMIGQLPRSIGLELDKRGKSLIARLSH